MIFDPRFKNPREISRTHVRKPFSRTHVRVPAYAPESVRGIVSDVCPMSCLCTVTVRLLLFGSFVWLGFCLCTGIGAVVSDPRGGGQRERATITNVIVRICESLPISPTSLNGTTLAWFTACGGDITADRVVCTNIVCAIPVQVAYRHFDVMFGCFVFGLESLAFQ